MEEFLKNTLMKVSTVIAEPIAFMEIPQSVPILNQIEKKSFTNETKLKVSWVTKFAAIAISIV